MCRRHSPHEQYKQAERIAKEHNLYIVRKNETYYIYRRVPGLERGIYLGHSSINGLFNKVSHLAATKEAQPCAA